MADSKKRTVLYGLVRTLLNRARRVSSRYEEGKCPTEQEVSQASEAKRNGEPDWFLWKVAHETEREIERRRYQLLSVYGHR